MYTLSGAEVIYLDSTWLVSWKENGGDSMEHFPPSCAWGSSSGSPCLPCGQRDSLLLLQWSSLTGKTPMRDEPLWTRGSAYSPLPLLSPSPTNGYGLAPSVGIGSLTLQGAPLIRCEPVCDQCRLWLQWGWGYLQMPRRPWGFCPSGKMTLSLDSLLRGVLGFQNISQRSTTYSSKLSLSLFFLYCKTNTDESNMAIF